MKQILVILILLVSCQLTAQYGNKFDVIDSRNGLSSDYVSVVKEGRNNVIWIGTDNGVVRYNGTVFKNFGIENGLYSNNVKDIHIDCNNRVWIFGSHNGLNFIKDNRVYYVQKAQKLKDLNFCFEDKGTVYFKSLSDGRCYFLTPGNSFRSYEGSEHNMDSLRYNIKSNFFSGYDKLLKTRFFLNFKNEFILDLSYTNEKKKQSYNLFSSCSKINFSKKLSKPEQSYNDINLLIDELKQDVPFYSYRDTLLLREKDKGRIFKNIGDLLHQWDKRFKTFLVDSNKNFWLIDKKNKLYLIKYKSLEIINHLNSSLFADSDVSIRNCCLAGDRIYFITNKNSFGYLDLISFKKKILKNFDQTLYNIFSSDKMVCVVMKSGKFIYNEKLNGFSFFKSKSIPVPALTFLTNENRLFSVYGHGIYGENKKKVLFDFTNLPFNHCSVKNDVVVLSNEKMIVSCNLKTNKKSKNAFIQQANCVKKIKDGAVVATGARVVYFLNNELKIEQRIALKENCYLIEYENNKVYLVSYKDITIYEKKQNKWFFLNKINYDEGILRGKISNLIFKKNKVIIISNNGISILKKSYFYKTNVAQIKINDFIIKQRSILNKNPKIIDQGKYDNILIKTSLSTFDNKDCFEVFYRLVKNKDYHNSSWERLTNRNIFLDNLPHGNYDLEVFAQDLSFPHHKTFDKISFTIKPYFWETNLFFTAAVLVYLLLFSIFLKYWKIRLNNRNKLKLELMTLELKSLKNQMEPHFLFNALNNLQSVLFNKGIEEANLFLSKFSKLLRSTLEITRDNIISLEEEIKYIKIYLDFEQERSNNDINVVFKIDQKLDLKRIEVPVMVVQTIVENAIMHGLNPSKNKKELVIEIFESDNRLYIIIEDNGVGRNKKRNLTEDHKSVALLIIEERFRILTRLRKKSHQLVLIDLEEKGISSGTKVIISIPLYFIC